MGEQGGNFWLSTHVATVISIVLTLPAGLVALYCFHYIFGAWGCLFRSLWSLPQMHHAVISPRSFWREQHLWPLLVAFSLRTHLSPFLILTCFLSLNFSSSSPQQAKRSSSSLGRERNRREGFCKTKPDLSLSYF